MKRVCLNLFLSIAISYRGISQDTLVLKQYVGDLKQIEVFIGGHSFNFLFDSGGGETFISTEVVNLLGKSVYGNATGFRMSGEQVNYRKCDSISLTINSTTIFHESLGVWDVMKILPKEFPKIDGVLSLKSFNNKIVTLDLANNRLIFETLASYRKKKARMTLLKSRFANGHNGNELTISLGISKLSRTYWFLFDSGNLGDVVLSHSTASEWGLESDTITQRKELGELVIPIGSKRKIMEASSMALIHDGALNYSIISSSIFVIDFPKRRVWVN